MRFKITLLFIFATLLFTLPQTLVAQVGQNVDAVTISSKYYNSIVKVLLYDSAEAKINPDKAYLGRGSGFFVSRNGYIFTNRHVIDMCRHGFCRYTTYNDETKQYEEKVDDYDPSLLTQPDVFKILGIGRPAVIVQVFTNSRGDSSKLYHATIIALDTANFDGAILKINSTLDGKPVTEDFHPVPIGNSDSLRQGQDICLFGFPAQYNGNFQAMLKDLSTLIFGKHSGYDYSVNTIYGFIKTDAVINSGNSGGPVFGNSNKVVGIATAAFNKTNVGLIGGIDAMYDLATLIPDLKQEVITNGLTAPIHKAPAPSVAFYKPIPLPSAKAIKHANSKAGLKVYGNSRAYRTYFVLGEEYGFVNHNTFSMNPYSDAFFTTRTGAKYDVPGQRIGFEIRIVKPSFLKQKNNLIGYFFNLEPSITIGGNWAGANFFTTTPFPLTMETKSDPELNLCFSFGLSYTYLFTSTLSLTAFYGPGVGFDPGNTKSSNNNGENNGGGNGSSNGVQIASFTIPSVGLDAIRYSVPNPWFVQTAGIIFKFKALYFGLDYHFASTVNLDFGIPETTNPGTPQAYTNTNIISGTVQRSTLSVLLAVAITRKK